MVGMANSIGALNQDPTMQDPVTGQPMAVPGGAVGALPETSLAPPAPGAGGNVTGAPLSQGTTQQSQAGGADSAGALAGAEGAPPPGASGPDLSKDRGTGEQVLMQNLTKDPSSMADLQEGIAKRIAAARKDPVAVAQMKQMTDLQEQQGIPADASKEELKEMTDRGIRHAEENGTVTKKEAGKLRKRFNKVYETIHRDEMGLFLLDFGLRAMMAGEQMGDMAAIGAAGSGALGALQGRRAEATATRVEDEKYSIEQAGEQYGRETDRQNADSKTSEAETKRLQAERSGGGYSGEKAFLIELGASVGVGKRDMLNMFSGGELPAVRFQKWMDFVGKTVAAAQKDPSLLPNQGLDPITGKKFSEFGPADMKEYADRMVQSEEDYASEQAFSRAASGSGVGNP